TAETAATSITAAAGRSIAAEIVALHLRRGNGRGGREIAALARAIECIAPRRRAQHPAGARVGVEPFDASVRPHPFEVIMLGAARSRGGTIGIIELAGMRAAHFGQDAIQ